METKRLNKWISGGALLLAVTGASPAVGQVVYGQPSWGAGNVVYTHWNIDSDNSSSKLSQLYIPITGFLPVQENFELQFYIASESNSMDLTTSDESVNGLTDLRLQANKSFAEDQLLVSGGLNLPTGKKELDPVLHQPIIAALASDYLEFPVRRFGEGFGFNLLVSGAKAFGEVRAGLSLGFRFVGEYTPYEGSGKYNPGDQISADIRGEIPTEQIDYTAGIGFVTYTGDQVDGAKVFEQGQQLSFFGSLLYHNESVRAGGTIRYLVRGDNTYFTTGEIILDELQLFGNELFVGGHADLAVAEGWRVLPRAHLRSIAENDVTESASVFGIGSDIARTITESLNLSVGLMYFAGSAAGGDLDLSGVQASAGLNATF